MVDCFITSITLSYVDKKGCLVMQKFEHVKHSKLVALIYKDLYNRRIRVDDVRGNIGLLIEFLEKEMQVHSYEKMIVKAREEQFMYFLKNGFILEGIVKNYFNGNKAFFMSKFMKDERRNSVYWVKEDATVSSVLQLEKKEVMEKDASLNVTVAMPHHAERLADLYQDVFKLYPVPLHNPEFIREGIRNGTIFVFIEHGAQIISAASAEICTQYNNAELTDCATRTSFRKGGYMKHLLLKLEQELLDRNIFCAYTIARSLSYGMNAVFHQLGYQYGGRLANNCIIFDKVEDMNIWEKNLSDT